MMNIDSPVSSLGRAQGLDFARRHHGATRVQDSDDDMQKQMEENVENKKHPKNAKNKKLKNRVIIMVKRRNSVVEKKERGISIFKIRRKAFRWGKNKNSKGAKPTLHEIHSLSKSNYSLNKNSRGAKPTLHEIDSLSKSNYSLSTRSQQSASHWQTVHVPVDNDDHNKMPPFRAIQNEFVDNVNRTPSPYRDKNLRQFVDNDEHNFVDNANSHTQFPSPGPFGHVLGLTPPPHLYNQEISDHPLVASSDHGLLLIPGNSSSRGKDTYGSSESSITNSENTESRKNGMRRPKRPVTRVKSDSTQEQEISFSQDDSSMSSSHMTRNTFVSSLLPALCCTSEEYRNREQYMIDSPTSKSWRKR